MYEKRIASRVLPGQPLKFFVPLIPNNDSEAYLLDRAGYTYDSEKFAIAGTVTAKPLKKSIKYITTAKYVQYTTHDLLQQLRYYPELPELPTKIMEVRDVWTFIPAIAIDLRGIMKFPDANVGILLMFLSHPVDHKFCLKQYSKFERTMSTVYKYLIKDFTSFASGDVIDVEYILGEKSSVKQSERFTSPF